MLQLIAALDGEEQLQALLVGDLREGFRFVV